MRLHRLTVTAFGPFAGVAVIDVDRLAAHGPFLLHGQTGAGKTTILDAVGYALFGVLPGARGADRLRSDHADVATATSVELEFSCGERRWRVVRSPKWQRPKRRGEGLVTQQPSVLVAEWTPAGWEPRTTRLDEAGQLLTEIVGMSADQFFQVVLLPQGDFARFLRSGTAERGALLEKLFGTGRFARAEAWLAEQRRAAAEEVRTAQESLCRTAARLAEAAGVGQPEGLPTAGWADAACADAARADADAELLAKDSTATALRVREELAAARSLADRQRRRRLLLDRAEVLRGDAPVWERERRRWAAGRRAAPVQPSLATTRRADDDAAAAREAERQGRRALDAAGLPQLPGEVGETAAATATRAAAALATSADLASVVLALREQAARLDQVAEIERNIPRRRAEWQATVDAVGRTAATTASLRAQLDTLPGRRAEIDAVVRAAREAQVALPGLRDRRLALARCLAASEELDLCEPDLAQAQAERSRRKEAELEAREAWLELRTLRLETMAGELAARLVPGAPCEVCGSTDHPAPAEVTSAQATQDAETAAESRFAEATAAWQDADSNVALLHARRAELLGILGGAELDSPALRQQLLEATTLERRTETAAGRGPQAEQERVALDAELDAGTRQLREADQLLTAGLAEAEMLAAQLGREAEAVAIAAGDCSSVADQRAALLARAAEVTGLVRLVEAREEAERTAVRAGEAADQVCRAHGWPDRASAAAASLPGEEVARLEAQLSAYDTEVATVARQLADPDIDVPVDPAVEWETLALVLADAEHRAEVDAGAATLARARRSQLLPLHHLFVTQVEQSEPLQRRAEQVRSIADLVAGTGPDNLRRQQLSAFVLQARLADVAAAATVRLHRMSGGRYALAHSDTLAAHGARSGLGLVIHDSWCGADRDPCTLSGGETFLASLALALGLADVVAAEAGGARVETLFVDEGFGSLDPDTLDEVLGVLDQLREGNRAVGLVSHVPELRQRIPAQLHVRKGRHGSVVEYEGC